MAGFTVSPRFHADDERIGVKSTATRPQNVDMLFIRTILLAGTTALLPAGCATRGTDPAPEIATLTRQADAWDKAIVAKDLAGIAANMCDDFRQIGPSGEVENRESFVRDLMSTELQIDPYTVEDFEIRLYGDTALLSGRTRMTGRYAGTPFTSHYRYIDVYVRRGGQWKVCSVQATRIAR